MMSQTKISPRSFLPVLVAVFASGLAACSLLVEFDPAGKPCGNGGACLDGYVCNAENKCVLDDGTVTPGADAGTTPLCGGKCTGQQLCLEKRNECVEPGCSTVACTAGEVCAMQGSTPACVAVEAGKPGAQCFHDSECPSDEFCLISSVPQDAQVRKGFCTKKCSSDTDCSSPEGMRSACIEITGTDFRLCMRVAEGSPANAPRPTYLPCQKNDDCADFAGRICAVFDNGIGSNKTLAAPVSLCDVAYSTGIKAGEACAPGNGDKAITGICIPGGTSTSGYASQRCASDADCFEGSTCRPSQFEMAPVQSLPEGTTFAVRRIDLCVKDSMRCGECTVDADCTPDAPKCVEMQKGPDPSVKAKYCTNECTSRISPSMLESGCPSGTTWSCPVATGSTRGTCIANSCGRTQ